MNHGVLHEVLAYSERLTMVDLAQRHLIEPESIPVNFVADTKE